ncbi:hypothetical protein M758_11G083400 [Ceratodon purpureus]|uniref:Uncharacterized protein n=1 Tax=Ceratodon purpureus TaxID=3225 RepID=A0A8T0GDX0_CERPU|nr:hypothetical protein KC19_11G086600 [Ceratodon purpureus]KAG0601092.1 hypothetical protein M758_11G083400 [Ceratodon purpureus]
MKLNLVRPLLGTPHLVHVCNHFHLRRQELRLEIIELIATATTFFLRHPSSCPLGLFPTSTYTITTILTFNELIQICCAIILNNSPFTKKLILPHCPADNLSKKPQPPM